MSSKDGNGDWLDGGKSYRLHVPANARVKQFWSMTLYDNETRGPVITPHGTVAPDGTINAQWESYKATGKITGNTAQIKWRGECGERVATGGRANGNTGSGSTTK